MPDGIPARRAEQYTIPPLDMELGVIVSYWERETVFSKIVVPATLTTLQWKIIWGARAGLGGLKESRTESWASREGRVDVGGVEGEWHGMKLLKN